MEAKTVTSKVNQTLAKLGACNTCARKVFVLLVVAVSMLLLASLNPEFAAKVANFVVLLVPG